MDTEREKLIGKRLRAFREALQIPRSKFAVTIGFGSERVASYESGRACVRYEVVRAISMHYQLSPYWLATGKGAPKILRPLDDSKFIADIRPTARFTDVYNKHLAATAEQMADDANEFANRLLETIQKANAWIRDESVPLDTRQKYGAQMADALAKLGKTLGPTIKFGKKVGTALDPMSVTGKKQSERTLTYVTAIGNPSGVKPTMPTLLARLNRATAQHGMKSKLAKYMSVPLPNVSQWLSGEREPSGETTLRLLYWVEQQERKS